MDDPGASIADAPAAVPLSIDQLPPEQRYAPGVPARLTSLGCALFAVSRPTAQSAQCPLPTAHWCLLSDANWPLTATRYLQLSVTGPAAPARRSRLGHPRQISMELIELQAEPARRWVVCKFVRLLSSCWVLTCIHSCDWTRVHYLTLTRRFEDELDADTSPERADRVTRLGFQVANVRGAPEGLAKCRLTVYVVATQQVSWVMIYSL